MIIRFDYTLFSNLSFTYVLAQSVAVDKFKRATSTSHNKVLVFSLLWNCATMFKHIRTWRDFFKYEPTEKFGMKYL